MDECLFENPLGQLPSEQRIPDDAPHWKREHFIPLRKRELVQLLKNEADLSDDQRETFQQLCRLLEAIYHHQFHVTLERLKDLYAKLNPDSVMKEPRIQGSQHEDEAGTFVSEVELLLRRANYQQLSQKEIERVVGAASHWGLCLDVDFDIFRRLSVFVRGDVVAQRTRRHWRTLYRAEDVDVPIFQRLVVIFHLHDCDRLDDGVDTECVYLKFFKNIPKQDVDMLLPGARFKMTLFDRGKIIFPTISGIAVAATKIVKGAVQLFFGGLFGILAFLLFVGGTLGYGVKSFMGYLQTKDKYQLNLTRSLYYQNLDNNAGVLFRILDEAEEQEFREAILAYALLRRRGGAEGMTVSQLDQAAEAYLSGVLEFDVDFEVHDALAKLEALGCAAQRENDRWRAIELEECVQRLDQTWDSLFHYDRPPLTERRR